MSPMVFSINFDVLGYGPHVSLFLWSPRISHTRIYDKSWRGISIGSGRLQVDLYWL